MINKILIIALNENWTGISRLPSGLNRVGFKVFALCPKKSFLAKTKYLEKSLLYPTFTYSRSKLIYLWMIYSLIYFKPDLIIPGDEDAIMALHKLSRLLKFIPYFNKFSKLIRKSLTPEPFDSLILSKSDFQNKCHEWGLRTPQNRSLLNVNDAILEAHKMGFPVVLKHDFGYGGSGVFICHNVEEIKEQFLTLKKKSIRIQLKEIFKKYFFISIFSNEQKISLQQYIEGPVGQAPFCAFEGVIFALNPTTKLHTYPGKAGPSSVIEGFKNQEIENFVTIIGKNLHYTGFGSVDFMIEEKTGKLYIIELNPRPTPSCHLSHDVVWCDLCDMFYKGLNGLPLTSRPFTPYTVAMFPGEKKRDPQSLYLINNFHDIPIDDPILLKALEGK
jgi:carbamoyl-phosphate synthase large subunit